ncbi:MAG: hypothetical protein HAW67_07465 [Endozoicomonadaceae bacterium]|nr:hypothetical protein [Endozoicomonadaceae bacterium]
MITDRSLSSDAFRVFVYLSSLADMDNWKVNNKDFIHKTGLSETRLAKSWKQLIAKGYVERELNRDTGVFRGYNYTINNGIIIDKRPSESLTKPIPTQKKLLSAPLQPKSASKPPSIKEIKLFMNNDQTCIAKIAEDDRDELSQKFYNYYQGVGWVINGNPIHCWQSVCVTWAINEKKRGKTGNNSKLKTIAEKRAEACHHYSHIEAIVPPAETLLDQPVSASVFLPEGEDW